MKITTRLFSTIIVLLLLSFTLGLIVAPSVLGLASVVDIGGTSGADINARYIAANQFQFNGTNILRIAVNGTARYITFPNNTGTIVYRNSSDTLTNKILTSPTLTSPSISTSALFGSGATWKVNYGGQPTFLTVTYGARVGSLALNNSYPITGANLTAPIFSGTATTAGTFTMPAFTAGGTVDGANQAFNNLGAAGNDFGATNTLVASTFSGDVDIDNNKLFGRDNPNQYLTGSGGDWELKVQIGSGSSRVFLIQSTNPITFAWNSTVRHSGFVLGGAITWHNSGSTGANAIILGSNSPATAGLAPATWIPVTLANGTQVYVPAWK